jgi:hypothetical protein
MQSTRTERATAQIVRCAQRYSAAGHSTREHCGKPVEVEASCVIPEICQTHRRRTYGGEKMSNRFTQYILIAMVLGIVMGALIFN